MKACVLCDVGRIEVRDVPLPRMGSRDVLLRISAVGICGTDAHIFSGHANYNTDAAGTSVPLTVQPQILGHEISGRDLRKLGAEVRDLTVGDRVVIDQGLNCVSAHREPRCEYCLSGDSHQCAFYSEHGITGLPGRAWRNLSRCRLAIRCGCLRIWICGRRRFRSRWVA